MNDWLTLGVKFAAGGRAERRLPCPNCARGDRDDAMGANLETGAYHCFRCGLKGRVGGRAIAPVPVRIDDPAIAERARERLRQTWKQSVALDKVHAARAYLDSRGLAEILRAPPAALRAHAGLTYWDKSTDLGTFPAMIALFVGAAGQATTLHVTYLRSDGCAKAPVPSPKKILPVPVKGSTTGGSIKLYPPVNGVLGVAEGIESALSLHLLARIPTWAAYCADNLARVRLPDTLRELHIGVDIDESGKGEQVAKALAARVTRWKSKPKVSLWHPDVPGAGDLNDELRRKSM